MKNRILICMVCGKEVTVKKYGFKNAGKKKRNYTSPMNDTIYKCADCRKNKEVK